MTFDLRSTPFVGLLHGCLNQLSPDREHPGQKRPHTPNPQHPFRSYLPSLREDRCAILQRYRGVRPIDHTENVKRRAHPQPDPQPGHEDRLSSESVSPGQWSPVTCRGPQWGRARHQQPHIHQPQPPGPVPGSARAGGADRRTALRPSGLGDGGPPRCGEPGGPVSGLHDPDDDGGSVRLPGLRDDGDDGPSLRCRPPHRGPAGRRRRDVAGAPAGAGCGGSSGTDRPLAD